MFRLSKVTDYGIRILANLARDEADGLNVGVKTARGVSERLALPLPMVSKVMKSLARSGILESHRGSKGGFSLAHRPQDLTVAGMVIALEGPVALTECSLGASLCEHEGVCSVQQPWSVINAAVQNTLATITLADLINPAFPKSGSVLSLGAVPADLTSRHTSGSTAESAAQANPSPTPNP